LIELDGVGLTANFFPASLAINVIKNPPNSTTLGPFINTTRQTPSGDYVGLQKIDNPILQPPSSISRFGIAHRDLS
jgi:hypothetical protein